MSQTNAQAGPSRMSNMSVAKNPPKDKRKAFHKQKTSKAAVEARAIDALEKAAMEFESPVGLTEFADLPISSNTKKGLKKAFFIKMTDIQAKSIPISLKGKDVLGAARTGSGKTLSFLVPVLETLYRRKWGPQDGLGALIISPTRELAVQIFEVLRAIGGYHSFSAGLVIGGKNLKDERERLNRMNILVATPGRLLQHMDQTFGFECDNIQTLVLDEADRILDMGFARTLNALLSHLPKSRQTLLFSATQTDSVKNLARLSLKDPVYIGVKEEGSQAATPKFLEQHYVVVGLDKKLDVLWSFIKAHLQSKVLVFMSSGKQVRFVYETFCKLQPGTPLLHLHGKQKQATRLATCKRFASTKHTVLLSTDLAARGLDFPAVDWVLQVDAPEDAETYIHRVGRTARYESHGKALLLLCPSEEEGMLAALQKKDINIGKIKIKESKTQSIEKHLQNLAFQDPEIKYLGQRAFVSYMRSIYLHKDKSIFQLDKLPTKQFAASLGLPGAPKIKLLSRGVSKTKKNASHMVPNALGQAIDKNGSSDSGSNSDYSGSELELMKEAEQSKKNGVRTKYDRMFERKNQNILSEHYSKMVDHDADGVDSEDDFITLKRADHDLDTAFPEASSTSKRKLKMGQSKKAMLRYHGQGEKLLFDEQGRPHQVYEMKNVEEEFTGRDILEAAEQYAEGEKDRLKQADIKDKQEVKEKRKEKKRKRKEWEKMEREDMLGPGAQISPDADGDGYVSPDFDFLHVVSEDDEGQVRRSKRSRQAEELEEDNTIDLAEEELALRLLSRS